MPLRRYLPRSLLIFVIATVVYLLQLFPFTGIFLMITLAPLWNGALFLLGFVALAVEAATGLTSRFWLVVPMAFAFGYGQDAWRSRAEADAFVAASAHVNDGKTIAFDPTRQALLFERTPEGGNIALADYDLPEYWTVEATSNGKGKSVRTTYHRLAAGDVCARIRADHGFQAAGIHAWGVHERRDGRSEFLDGICAIGMPGEPDRPIVRVTVGKRVTVPKDRQNRWTQTITIRSGDETISLQRAGISPLPWIPQPLLGCFLNSAAPRWECDAGWGRDRERLVGATSNDGAIAAALGLVASPASTRRAAIAARPDPDFGPLVAARETASLANLDQALADPARRLTVFDIAGLTDHPDLYADRATPLVAALDRRLAASKADRETPRNLAILLAALPEADLASILPDLIAVWQKIPADELDENVVPAVLVQRLVAFGETALPIVERLAFDRPRTANSAAMRALCRLAPLSDRDAEKIAARLSVVDRMSADFDAAALALLRLGRRDLAEPILREEIAKELAREEERRSSTAYRLLSLAPTSTSRATRQLVEQASPRRKKIETWLATIDPASPPEICDVK